MIEIDLRWLSGGSQNTIGAGLNRIRRIRLYLFQLPIMQCSLLILSLSVYRSTLNLAIPARNSCDSDSSRYPIDTSNSKTPESRLEDLADLSFTLLTQATIKISEAGPLKILKSVKLRYSFNLFLT